ncbi:hypothetical protein [Powai lake megavirus]|uniref:Uncharacterized protein n=1 Tax=Powai lake megavirus TaxID=1842663 RepID=A0A167RDA9_9VIRU|nr:hypothetical protein QJ849_gp392 [Powai lake megavirus]ANB50554.1 hypothetical protein [Powai lake megavirus]
MFSNMTDVTEAWDRDPVKEMTQKINNGNFDANKQKNRSIYKFKNSKNNDSVSLSENSYSLSSRNSLSSKNQSPKNISTYSIDSDLSTISPPKLSKYSKLKFGDILNLSEIINSDPGYKDKTKCENTIKHIKKCNKCYDQLKKLVDMKVGKKIDEIILDNKLKQIQAFTPNLTQPPSTTILTSTYDTNTTHKPIIRNISDSWKETLVIVIGIIIALLIIFLIIKAICK